MKFLHTSDWHVGRTLNGWSLLEEQEWAFQQIVDLAISEQVDGVIIAGDLYDRAVPPVDAIKLFNKTLARLVLEEQIPVYAISGNHDGIRKFRELVMPWPTFSRIWKKLLILTRPIFW